MEKSGGPSKQQQPKTLKSWEIQVDGEKSAQRIYPFQQVGWSEF
ncbi:MAG: hypothetical protein CM15mV149_180 [uncultured marine virus]|nr:MAG: hypothetical protein CM15mV149_180 [uncultured marine virus]